MHFLRYPNPLWFLQAGGGEEVQKTASLGAYITVSVSETSVAFSASTSAIPFSISAGYNISLSALDVTSVQVELSGFAYNVTASTNTSLLAFVSVDDDGPFGGMGARISAIPVYTLAQAGQVNYSASAAYNITASAATASIASYISLSAAYQISASCSYSVLIADQYSVSVACTISTSLDYNLSKTQEAITLSKTLVAPITCSLTPILVIDRGGGLVWSRKKRKRVPVKVGYPLRDE